MVRRHPGHPKETDGGLAGGVGGELERNKVGKVTTIHLPISTSW